MSVALELWRALEAWDPDRHPRGPGGRFIKALGSSGPSLADVVRGTAAGGQKRQRTDRGGMTVGDAVRAAARQSDTTGRPTQRPVAEHRAHGAHDVADEVDHALADAGVPEDVRRQVSGRARAAADSHGARPDSLPKPSKKLAKLSDEQLANGLSMHGNQTPRGKEIQAEVTRRRVDAAPSGTPAGQDQVKADVRAAVMAIHAEKRHEWVGMADLRDRLSGHSRTDVDAALKALSQEDGLRLVPVANRKGLKARDHDAAMKLGDDEINAVQMPGSQNLDRDPGHPLLDHTLETYSDKALTDAIAMHGEGDPIGAQLAAELARRRQAATPAGARNLRADAYEQMDARTLNQMASINAGIDTTGMSKRQIAEALAAHDERLAASAPQYGNSGVVEVGRPVITDLGPRPGGPVDRTEIGGWKGGRTSRPQASRTFTAADAATVASHLETATSRDDARARLRDLTAPQLRQIAKMLGATVGSKYTKAKIADTIVQHAVGRRLDSAAIDRMARGT